MKRCWMGFFLLLLLLLSGLGAAWAMDRIHSPMEDTLNRAAEAALAGNWELAGGLYENAREDWEKWEGLRACFADHTPMEEAEADLAALEIYARAKDPVAFAAAGKSLARQIAAIGQAHAPVWRNFF